MLLLPLANPETGQYPALDPLFYLVAELGLRVQSRDSFNHPGKLLLYSFWTDTFEEFFILDL